MKEKEMEETKQVAEALWAIKEEISDLFWLIFWFGFQDFFQLLLIITGIREK